MEYFCINHKDAVEPIYVRFENCENLRPYVILTIIKDVLTGHLKYDYSVTHLYKGNEVCNEAPLTTSVLELVDFVCTAKLYKEVIEYQYNYTEETLGEITIDEYYDLNKISEVHCNTNYAYGYPRTDITLRGENNSALDATGFGRKIEELLRDKLSWSGAAHYLTGPYTLTIYKDLGINLIYSEDTKKRTAEVILKHRTESQSGYHIEEL